jgi:hypothetical protein
MIALVYNYSLEVGITFSGEKFFKLGGRHPTFFSKVPTPIENLQNFLKFSVLRKVSTTVMTKNTLFKVPTPIENLQNFLKFSVLGKISQYYSYDQKNGVAPSPENMLVTRPT